MICFPDMNRETFSYEQVEETIKELNHPKTNTYLRNPDSERPIFNAAVEQAVKKRQELLKRIGGEQEAAVSPVRSEEAPVLSEIQDVQVNESDFVADQLDSKETGVEGDEKKQENKDVDGELDILLVEVEQNLVSDDILDSSFVAQLSTTILTEDESGQLNREKLEKMQAFIEKNVTQALESRTELRGRQEKNRELLQALQERIKKAKRKPEWREMMLAQKLRAEIAGATSTEQLLYDDNPDAFFALHLQDLLAEARELRNGGRLVETTYVKEKAAQLQEYLQQGRVVILHGETGTGKTELAKLIGRRYAGQEPLLVRGYPTMTGEELFGSTVLTAAETDQGTATVSEFSLGPVYEAMRDGRVLILDEVNYINPGLMAKLNDMMTRVAGDRVLVQEDSGMEVTVKEGFGIILTGNIDMSGSKRYEMGRSGFDVAMRDRLTFMEYDYLPQATEGGYSEVETEQKQTFEILLASVINDEGSAILPAEAIEQIWRLAQLSAVTQKMFAGKMTAETGYGFTVNGGSQMIRPKSLLSNRGGIEILRAWQEGLVSSTPRELDFYIYQQLVEKAENAVDRAYFYQLAQTFGFFKSEGWNQRPEYDAKKNVGFQIGEVPQNMVNGNNFISQEEIITALYGDAPERTEWPSEVEINEDEQGEKMSAEILLALEGLEKEIDESKAILAQAEPMLNTYCVRE